MGVPCGSDRTRRIRDAVEAALSDIILLGTEEHVRLAERAARELVAGRPVHTHDLVVSLRAFIREALDLDPIPSDLSIPMQGPTRPSTSGGRNKNERGKEEFDKAPAERAAVWAAASEQAAMLKILPCPIIARRRRLSGIFRPDPVPVPKIGAVPLRASAFVSRIGRVSPNCMILWCARRDSNPHDFTHCHLKAARLPIPPRALGIPAGAMQPAGSTAPM